MHACGRWSGRYRKMRAAEESMPGPDGGTAGGTGGWLAAHRCCGDGGGRFLHARKCPDGENTQAEGEEMRIRILLGQETAVLLLLCVGVLLLMGLLRTARVSAWTASKGKDGGETGSTGRHGLPGGEIQRTFHRVRFCRGRGDGESIFQRYRGWWWAVKCAANV